MGLCHSHNASCKCVLVGNVADDVEAMAMRKTSKCEVDKDNKYFFMQLLQQEMLPKKVNRNIMYFFERKEREELFKEMEHFLG